MKFIIALVPLATLIAIPLSIREPGSDIPAGAQTLVIITPHNENARAEFENAFRAYAQDRYPKPVAIDWRTPGGTSEITRYVDDQFKNSILREFGGKHPREVVRAFKEAGAPPKDNPLTLEFLASDLGIGIDLFFGGGQIEYIGLANKGYLVDCGIIQKHPEWFTDDVISEKFGGETFYDKDGRYFGVCLASFGICYNRDRLALMPDAPIPDSWRDLGDPGFFSTIGMADPTKSGSINKCFEMMIQQGMAEASAQDGGSSAPTLARGWTNTFLSIKRIAANSRYVTDAASKVVRDVAQGDAAAGMCIDSYGRTQGQWIREATGQERMLFVVPAGGTSVAADPIACLRGAPHRELAVLFIEFTLSVEGQKLWNYRPGIAGGPRQRPLRRWPIRKDLYTDEHRRNMTDADRDPYELTRSFRYEYAWTGPYFTLIKQTIKAVVLDPRPELVEAWSAIIAAGGPERVPEAMAELAWMPFDHADAAAMKKELASDPLQTLKTLRGWTEQAQAHYRTARDLARQAHSTGSGQARE
jgi:ABC-type Fe3+ transport system substrate-binding protein